MDRRWRAVAPLVALATVASAGLVSCGGALGVAEPFDVEFREPRPGEVRITTASSVGAGLVNLRLRNTGESTHGAQLVRIGGEHTQEQVLDYFRSLRKPGSSTPSWLRLGGGAARVEPGASVSVRQRLAEGDWYLVDTQQPEQPTDATPFYEQGGIVAFTVTSGGSHADLPSGDARITARDYEFNARSLAPGTQSVRFENRGRQPHHLVALPLVPGATFDEARAFLSSPAPDPAAQPPVDMDAAVELAMIDRGVSLLTSVRLTRGTWVFACFLTDRTGGPDHIAKGMLQEIKVGS